MPRFLNASVAVLILATNGLLHLYGADVSVTNRDTSAVVRARQLAPTSQIAPVLDEQQVNVDALSYLRRLRDDLKAEIEALLARKAQLEAELKQVGALAKQLEDLKALLATRQEQNAIAERRLSEINKAADGAKTRREKDEEAAEAIRNGISARQAQVAALQQETKQLIAQRDQNQSEAANADARKAQVLAVTAGLEKDLTKLRNDADLKTARVNQLRTQMLELQQSADRLRAGKAQLEKDAAAAKTGADKQVEQRKQQDAASRSLQEQLAELQAKFNSTQSAIQGQERQFEQEYNRLEATKTQAQQAQAARTQAVEELNSVTQQIRSAKEQLAALQRHIQVEQGQVMELQEDNEVVLARGDRLVLLDDDTCNGIEVSLNGRKFILGLEVQCILTGRDGHKISITCLANDLSHETARVRISG